MFFINFILIPCLCASIAATTAAPLGGIIAWRKLVYFGEALSHSAWLGIALALYFNLPIYLGIWLINAVLIFLLFFLKTHSKNDTNNILGTLAHLFLALGVILLSQMQGIRTDLFSYLFGDILNTTFRDLILSLIIAIVVFISLFFIWDKLILLTINEDIAKTENPRIIYYEAIFLLVLGLFTGLMMQILGLMLIVAFFIIPIQTASKFGGKTPEQCVILAILISLISTIMGFVLAYLANFPVAPSIVAIMSLPYFVSQFFIKKI